MPLARAMDDGRRSGVDVELEDHTAESKVAVGNHKTTKKKKKEPWSKDRNASKSELWPRPVSKRWCQSLYSLETMQSDADAYTAVC